ncbi:MAG TPA: type II secretion system F family protein [Beijerinckiaceae bacterium]|jgi:tight adherence protein B
MKDFVLFGLTAACVAGVAYAIFYDQLSGGSAQEKRQKALMTRKKTVEKEASRRRAIADTLKDLEVKGARRTETLEARIAQAGLTWSRSTYFIVSAVTSVVTAVALLLLSGSLLIAAFGLLIGGLGLPTWFLKRRKAKRIAAFSEAFPGAIDVIVRGIKAGLPLADCLRIIANEAPEPLRGEFREAIEAQQLGLTLGEAVDRLAERMPTAESNFFAIVVNIQAKAGGNLSEALGNLSRVLRERKKMKLKIKAMSSEATSSAAIIGALPPIVALLVYITTPDYISLLWTTSTGQVVLVIAGFWMSVGIGVMKKMINFDM